MFKVISHKNMSWHVPLWGNSCPKRNILQDGLGFLQERSQTLNLGGHFIG